MNIRRRRNAARKDASRLRFKRGFFSLIPKIKITIAAPLLQEHKGLLYQRVVVCVLSVNVRALLIVSKEREGAAMNRYRVMKVVGTGTMGKAVLARRKVVTTTITTRFTVYAIIA